ncbi:MAG: XRE family transcriptional regulator [Bifidobacteriales bacterium]|nr:XRE family transcriptional regulator [Bifidobacteriales bacterium]
MKYSDINQRIASRVDAAIKASGIKKVALSEKTGMPSSTLNSKLRAYTPFTVEEVFRIAEVISCDPILLLSDKPQNQKLAA